MSKFVYVYYYILIFGCKVSHYFAKNQIFNY